MSSLEPAAPAPRPPSTAWLGLGSATGSALLLVLFWLGVAWFGEHGLDLGYATPLAFVLLLGLAGLVHVGASVCVALALLLRARPLSWSLTVALANLLSLAGALQLC